MKSSTVALIAAVIFSLYLLQSNLFATKEPSPLSTHTSPRVEKPTAPTKATTITVADTTAKQRITKDTPTNQDAPMQIAQRPKWKLTGDIASQLRALQHQTANGDHQARYILAMNYRYCFNAASSEKELEEKLQQTQEFTDSSRVTNNINVKYQYCVSVDTQQRQSYYNHLLNAANNGQVAAQEVIGSVTANQYMQLQSDQKLQRSQYIAKRDNFIEQKLQLLERAAQHGSIKDLMRLSNLQRSQNYGPNGYTKAYAYNQIILELTEDNDIHNRYSWFQQKLYDQLTPQEIEQAQEITATWLTEIRQNGTLYL